jgi:hypothetical protein
MYKTAIFIISLLLISCGESNRLLLACENNPAFCSATTTDILCHSERTDVINNNYNIDIPHGGRKTLKLLESLEAYSACSLASSAIITKDPLMDITASTSHKRTLELKQKANNLIQFKQNSIKNYYSTKNILTAIQDDIATSNDPYALYWHWSRFQDDSSITKLLELDKTNKLNAYDLLFFVSQEHSKYNYKQATNSMNKSLSLYPKDLYLPLPDKRNGHTPLSLQEKLPIHIMIIRGMTHGFYKNKDYKRAYIWSLLSEMNNDPSAKSDAILPLVEAIPDVNIRALKKIAEQLHTKLSAGTFVPI